jgi:hypothetical protein
MKARAMCRIVGGGEIEAYMKLDKSWQASPQYHSVNAADDPVIDRPIHTV